MYVDPAFRSDAGYFWFLSKANCKAVCADTPGGWIFCHNEQQLSGDCSFY